MVSLIFQKSPAKNEVFEANSRKLLVEAGGTQLSVLLWNCDAKRIDGIEVFNGVTDWDSDFSVMLQQSQLLQLRELETEVFVNSERFLPLPAFLYEKEAAKDQLSTLFSDPPDIQFTGADVLPQEEMILCWEAPQNLIQLLQEHFLVVRCKSMATLLIQLMNAIGPEVNKGMILISESMAWVCLGRSGQLLCVKNVQVQHPEDLSYFLLNLTNQWGIESSRIHWNVSGMLDKDSPLLQSPYRFFENYSLWEGESYSHDIPGHFFSHYAHYLSLK
ncbi:MAG: DUF3822 family protein [Chitinophagaceae bacterium]|nr:DUF3822 family protein [Chitinophagaceae bacterium]